jgi:hypothetical protein
MSGIRGVVYDGIKIDEAISLQMSVLGYPRIQNIPLHEVVTIWWDGTQDRHSSIGFYTGAHRFDICLYRCLRYFPIREVISAAQDNDEMRVQSKGRVYTCEHISRFSPANALIDDLPIPPESLFEMIRPVIRVSKPFRD